MTWLSGWEKRIKLTVDQTKIDTADLTWFPVTVFLTATHGEEVFTELTSDANYMKVAFTKDDGTTELYAECEKFDRANQVAIYHVSKDGWVISNTTDTDFYMYYDNDHADNTDYIGAIDTTAGGNVWDSNFKAIHHMVDATTSTIKDSTSNNNDGTKKAANEPIGAAGKVGLGQDFDGANDYILTAAQVTDWTKDFTISGWIEPDVVDKDQGLMGYGHGNVSPYYSWRATLASTHFIFTAYDGTGRTITGVYTAQANVGFYVTIVYDGDSSSNNASIYINDVLDITGTVITKLRTDAYDRISIGTTWVGEIEFFNGVIDEVRVSSVTRSVAWIKATYNSLFDTLLTYGSEELGFFTLTINELLHSQTIDNLVLIQNLTLVINELLHSQTIDNLILIENKLLAIQDILHSQGIDNTILTQVHNLTVQDILHSQSIEGLSLTVATKYEYYNTNDDIYMGFYDEEWVAQTFTPSVAHTITSVKLLSYRFGSPGTITVGIRATDVNGKPTGNDLCSGTTNGDTLPTAAPYEWREITFGAGYNLSAGTKYAIVVRLVGSATNRLYWRADTSSPTYGNGQHCGSSDSGVSWSVVDSIDMMFEDWGLTQVYNLTVQDILHSQGIDSLSLIQNLTLIIQEMLHSQSMDGLILTWSYLLVIRDILHSQNIDIIKLIMNWKEKLSEPGVWTEKDITPCEWVEKVVTPHNWTEK